MKFFITQAFLTYIHLIITDVILIFIYISKQHEYLGYFVKNT